MQISVMLSIKPFFAEQIFDGTKRFEFRRKLFANRDVKKIVVYVTEPIGKVIGEFEIEEIIELKKERLWEQTKEFSGIEKEFFDSYFSGQETGFAIKVGKTNRYKTPLDLKDHFNVNHPPQSFRYITQ